MDTHERRLIVDGDVKILAVSTRNKKENASIIMTKVGGKVTGARIGVKRQRQNESDFSYLFELHMILRRKR